MSNREADRGHQPRNGQVGVDWMLPCPARGEIVCCVHPFSSGSTMDAMSRRHPTSTELPSKVDSEAVLTVAAKALGADVAPAADCGIAGAVPLGPQERWIAENLEALKSSNAYVEQHGLPLAKHHNS